MHLYAVEGYVKLAAGAACQGLEYLLGAGGYFQLDIRQPATQLISKSPIASGPS